MPTFFDNFKQLLSIYKGVVVYPMEGAKISGMKVNLEGYQGTHVSGLDEFAATLGRALSSLSVHRFRQ